MGDVVGSFRFKPRAGSTLSALNEFGRAVAVKQRVFQALITRFVIGRYGRENIGFMWTIVEPMILCVGVMAIWTFTKGSSEHGVNIVAFVLTGYLPLTLWRHQTNYAVNCLRQFKFLTIFGNLKLFDAMMSRFILEFVSVSAAATVVMMVLYVATLIPAPHDWGGVLLGWLMMGALATGMGVVIAAFSETTELVEKVNQPFQYFMLPFCGCFYMVSWIPEGSREYALYIPTVHSYEMIRAGLFGPEMQTFGSPFYGFAWALLLAGLGFFMFERVKDHVDG